MPESSTAIFAARTEPAPARSVYKLDMSDSTPILIMLSEICACAPPKDSAAATAAATMVIRFVFIDPPLKVLRFRLHAEIFVQLVHVGVEFGVGNHVGHAPMLDHVVPVRDGGREAEVLLDQQDGEPLLLEPRDRAADLLHDHRRKALGRLVEQQQARSRAQDAADREHLLLAAGKLGALAAPP